MTRALPPEQVLQDITNDPNIRGLQESIPRLAGAFAQRGNQQRLIDLSRIAGDSSNPQGQINALNELAAINPQISQAISQGAERRQGTLEDLRTAKIEKTENDLAYAASWARAIINAPEEQKDNIYQQSLVATKARGIEFDPKNTPLNYYPGMEKEYLKPLIDRTESLGLVEDPQQPLSPEGKRAFDIEQGFLKAGFKDPEEVERDFKRATSLRKEATTVRNQFMQNSRTFIVQKSAYDKILASAKESILPGSPRAAADLALIFNYMKILDPNSAVLPGEAATVQQSGSLPQWIVAKYNSLVKGGRLETNLRKDFIERSGMIFNTALITQENLEKEFNKIAKDGNLKNVVIDYINDTTAYKKTLAKIEQEDEQPTTTIQQPTTQKIRRYNPQTGKIE